MLSFLRAQVVEQALRVFFAEREADFDQEVVGEFEEVPSRIRPWRP